MMNNPDSLQNFVDQMTREEVDAATVAAMEQRLVSDPELRRRYREQMRLEANLTSAFRADRPDIVPPVMQVAGPRRLPRRWIALAGVGLAAAVAMAFFIGSEVNSPVELPVIAHLESSSEAAWIQAAPSRDDKALTAGVLHLQRGLAELRLTSGVLVALEGPARVELIDPMRCRLFEGVAVVQVPDGIIGFVVETPDGHAVDHGTRFAVNVNPQTAAADFEVLDGRISVHHPRSGSVVSLEEAEAARLTSDGIEGLAMPPSEVVEHHARPGLHRLRTGGHETSIVRVEQGKKQLLDPDLLVVKKDLTLTQWTDSKPPHFARDRRSLVGFDLGGIDPEKVQAASLQLNLVPTGLGFASALPETCTFDLYGIRDDATLEAWPSEGLRWADAPGSDGHGGEIADGEVSLLAQVDVPRGRTSGPVVFSSQELTSFVRDDTTGAVGFLIVRSTPPLDSYSRVHAFAASSHPDAAGPTLELQTAAP